MSVKFINLFFIRIFKREGVILLKSKERQLSEKKGVWAKKEKEKFKNFFVIFLVCLFIFGPVLGMSYFSFRISEINREIANLKEIEKTCEQEYNIYKLQYAQLTSPEKLMEKMEELNLRIANADEVYSIDSRKIAEKKMANNYKIKN